jgi:hypothetical protein
MVSGWVFEVYADGAEDVALVVERPDYGYVAVPTLFGATVADVAAGQTGAYYADEAKGRRDGWYVVGRWEADGYGTTDPAQVRVEAGVFRGTLTRPEWAALTRHLPALGVAEGAVPSGPTVNWGA